jgi:general secretion pathway protein D
MPEITRRDIIANVKVYDGDTLVLGGMLTEEAKGSDDSFPGTSNVPLVGWLGRMQTSDKDKTNLMIFVTARIVNPDGLPIKRSPENGKFDFGR